jgi:hypothetical protein
MYNYLFARFFLSYKILFHLLARFFYLMAFLNTHAELAYLEAAERFPARSRSPISWQSKLNVIL